MILKRISSSIVITLAMLGVLAACKQQPKPVAVVKKKTAAAVTKKPYCCESNIPARFPTLSTNAKALTTKK